MLAERYDWLSPAILRFIRRVVAQTDPPGIDLTVCGEMGGRQLEALALLGVGIRRLSITPAAVGPIKELVHQVDLAAIGSAMAGWLAAPPVDMRAELQAWAADNRIVID
jgi:phosphotransferase system enzyme I (PtsP)